MRRTLWITFFLGIIVGFLYLANLVVYKVLASMFDLDSAHQLLVLGFTLGALSSSFIIATLLGMKYYNWFTRIYYALSAVWMGFFVYLFLSSALYGIVAVIFGEQAVFGILCLFISFVAGVYGLIHARNIKVNNVRVRLPNLPKAWKNHRAVWVSDLHLGQLHGQSFARKVVEKINSVPHDIVFIGGDLFDGTRSPDIAELIAPLKQLNAPLGTYFVTGNHEEFGNGAKFIEAVRSVGINMLMDKMIDIDGLQLIGVDYSHASKTGQFKEILQKLRIDSQKPSILLKHEPMDLAIAEEASISLQISGHTHRAQQWPLEYVARAVYKGFSYGLRKFKNMQVYVSSGAGTWGPPVRVGTNSEIVVFSFI